MNFFKSIILDDPDPPKPENPHESDPDSPTEPSQEDRSPDGVTPDGSAWSFGGLIKTLATRSESVIETYSKDLMEFGSGLRKETEIIREAASRAVKDLPASLEAGTSAAHGVLDGVLKSTAEIISKEQASASDGESDTPETNRSLNSGRYSRFDAQLSAIQSDVNSFCEEPEDVEEYKKWKSSFKLDQMSGEIEDLIGDGGNLEDVYKRLVPNVVDQETFWYRYFYRVDKLKLKEKVRANLVQRAISADEDDDELSSWEVDDDDEVKDGNAGEIKTGEQVNGGQSKGANDGITNLEKSAIGSNVDGVVENNLVKSKEESGGEGNENVDGGVENNLVKSTEENKGEGNEEEVKTKSEESHVKEEKNENVGPESSGIGNVSETQVKMEEEDLSWDEIEDIGSGDDEKKTSTTSSERPNRAEVRKQLNATEDEDEDLSWDVEEDDEPVKS